MLRAALAALLLLALLPAPPAAAEAEVGAPAPDFLLQGSDGKLHSLAQHAGKRGVVLAWFPKAFTPG